MKRIFDLLEKEERSSNFEILLFKNFKIYLIFIILTDIIIILENVF